MHDLINCKEQAVLESTKDVFEGENKQNQYSVLGQKNDLYFQGCKSAIEVAELGHNDKNVDYDIQRKRVIEKEFDGMFIIVYYCMFIIVNRFIIVNYR